MRRIGVLGFIVAMVFSFSYCGGTPAIGDLRTITLTATPSTNLVGEGGTVQLSATGVYSTGTRQDITRRVTFTATPTGSDLSGIPLSAPPNSATINATGLVTAVTPFVCTWHDASGGSSTPAWFVTGSYQIVATYHGISSQPVFISVAAASGDGKNGACGP
jgi:hypothetical protein